MLKIQSAGLLLIVAGSVLSAQPAQFNGPLSGFLFDPPSRTVRPILGVPGAARLGPAVLTEMDFASVAPDGGTVIGLSGGQAVLVHPAPNSVFQPAVLENALAGIDRAVWAADSSAVVIASSARRQVQRISLSDPRAAGDPIELPGEISTLAANSDATLIVAGVRSETDGGLYLLSAGTPPIRILPMTDPASAGFAGDHVLYVADRATGEIFCLRSLSAAPEVTRLFSSADGITEPVGIAVTSKPSRISIADKSRQVLRVYDLSSHQLLSETALDAPPAFLSPLTASVYQLTARASLQDLLLVYDGRTAAVYFVPTEEEE